MQLWQELLDFWFSQEPSAWFAKNPTFDTLVKERFEKTLQQAAAGQCDDWWLLPRATLALVLLFDQIPRNIYRDKAQAFAYDSQALSVSRHAILSGFATSYNPTEKSFLYLPFEHSEILADQYESVRCYRALLVEVDAASRPQIAENLDYAIRHLKIIERFGRFPHRNTILGRPSSAEELAFLKEPNSSF